MATQQIPMLSVANGVLGIWGGGMKTEPLKACFPWAGGKSKVADLVWSRIGNVDNWIEPFAGTAAVTLRRPDEHFRGGYRVETINDADHNIVNVWRAIKYAPDEVAKWADEMVMEASLHSFHKWLVRGVESPPEPPPEWSHGVEAWNQAYTLIRGKPWDVAAWKKLLAENPEYFDAKVAGRWLFGVCCWIGSGWCAERGVDSTQMEIGGGTYGVSQRGVHQPAGDRIPLINQDGQGYGVNRGPEGRPQLADAFDIGRGVNSIAGHLK